MYGHLCTYEALSRILWAKFRQSSTTEKDTFHQIDEYIENVQQKFSAEVVNVDEISASIHLLRNSIKEHELERKYENFRKECSDSNSNFKFWIDYMSMVEILLDFIRANREGDWGAHIDAFKRMLPWLCVYDHTNYTRWGPVYLNDMQLLPKTAPAVYESFKRGNFVVQRSSNPFCKVPVDQATEWVNKTCKISNGVIGITLNDTARDKFCLSWNEKALVLADTRRLFGLSDEDCTTFTSRKEADPSRLQTDEKNVINLMTQFK